MILWDSKLVQVRRLQCFMFPRINSKNICVDAFTERALWKRVERPLCRYNIDGHFLPFFPPPDGEG